MLHSLRLKTQVYEVREALHLRAGRPPNQSAGFPWKEED